MFQTTLLVIPGWQNSGPGHWQSLFETKYGGTRIMQDDWMTPRPEDWISRIDVAIRSCPKPPLLLAHSLGCTAIALWAGAGGRQRSPVAGALLVSPPDIDRKDMPAEVTAFRKGGRVALPFPARVVASANDPYCGLAQAREIAKTWHAAFVAANASGHINEAAGNGPWPEGEKFLEQLAREINALR
jgi:predicted alpha/beta hydrolase family esterase